MTRPSFSNFVSPAQDDAEWQGDWGDRRTRLVLIGQGGAPGAAAAALEGALLTDAEMAVGEAAWEALPNPWASLEGGVEEGEGGR